MEEFACTHRQAHVATAASAPLQALANAANGNIMKTTPPYPAGFALAKMGELARTEVRVTTTSSAIAPLVTRVANAKLRKEPRWKNKNAARGTARVIVES